MDVILETLINSKKFGSYIKDVKSNKSPIMLSGLTSVAKVQMMSATTLLVKRPLVYIVSNEIDAKNALKDFEYFNKNAVYFPKRDIKNFDTFAESKENLFERNGVLQKLLEKKADVIVTTIDAITQPMILPKDLYNNKIEIKLGDIVNISDITEKLVKLGYERQDLVDGASAFSVRGGIIDVSLEKNKGVRIELWGDEVESIRNFNTLTQRSEKDQKSVKIYPATEFILSKSLNDVRGSISNISVKGKILSNITDDLVDLKNSNYINKIEKYFCEFYPEFGTFLDYLSNDYLIVINETNKLQNRLNSINKDNQLIIQALYEKGRYGIESLDLQQTYKMFMDKLVKSNKNLIYIAQEDTVILNKQSMHAKRNGYSFNYREVNFFRNTLDFLFEEIKEKLEKKNTVILLAGGNPKALAEMLENRNIKYNIGSNIENIEENKNLAHIYNGELSTGFFDEELKVLVISFGELFQQKQRKLKVIDSYKKAEKIRYADLELGDYVVHRIYGIGRFIEIMKITNSGISKDYIKIEYRGGDFLYVPTNALDNVRKYISKDGITPKLSKLGTKDWEKTQKKVKNQLREVAEELVLLYAERNNQKGFAFSPDTVWQKELEESFEYQETEDQIRCIEEIKEDMYKLTPMDRLLCGDVGFGKTEVAIRAAFKAVQDNKQVAYLVPTTILAKQQYDEFSRRMEKYPVNINFLSRFKTKKEQNEIVEQLRLGKINIIIGTHRILSEDVSFKDLGLLIIDEEHRFGVKDKEKIKMLKKSVDVLSMTATPIPRTINMSLSGIRDMSIIYDPPINRKAIKTYVLEYDLEIIKEAILAEAERGGQSYYLFNRVQNIESKMYELERHLPNIKFAYAHGQMTPRQIENIMQAFIDKEIDVLISTTIMESGIDIPNANTIIVEDADRLGLAQLYQIRGRVGRSERQAYAYITFKRNKVLSEVSEKRLKAIKEFTELGSGFKIAMRDLEIRGAGSLLGEIQHGHMEQVGYDTYISILQEVIKESKGEAIEKEEEIYIDLNVSQFIPDEYIEKESLKIDVYQEIFSAKTINELEEVKVSILDRFGKYGVELENLFNIAKIKLKAKEKKLLKIIQKQNKTFFYLPQNYQIRKLESLIEKYKHNLKFSKSNQNYIVVDFENYNKNKRALERKNKDDIIKKENINNFNKKTIDILEFLEIL